MSRLFLGPTGFYYPTLCDILHDMGSIDNAIRAKIAERLKGQMRQEL